jgi:phosphatidylserine/phosphatidylglycerophosphate/cardiolipin synthase-like enzyme
VTTVARRIYKSTWQSGSEIRELLQGIFVAELLRPSRCVWIISPWISDIAVIDNSMATFDMLNPSWGAREWRISEVLIHLLRIGTVVRVATRPGAPNRPVLPRLSAAVEEFALPEGSFRVFEVEELHEKGLVGDDYHLSGSMNLTFNGVELLDEMVTFDVSPEAVAEARLVYYRRWGGRLPGQTGARS